MGASVTATHRRREGAAPEPRSERPVVAFEGDAIIVDAAVVAPRLGLTAERFMMELRRGLVFQVVETGVEADAGRIRLTFRYRSQEARMVLDADGREIEAETPSDRPL